MDKKHWPTANVISRFTNVLMAVPDVRVSRGWISEGTSQPKGPLWVVEKQSRKQQYRQGASVGYTAPYGGKSEHGAAHTYIHTYSSSSSNRWLCVLHGIMDMQAGSSGCNNKSIPSQNRHACVADIQLTQQQVIPA
jgi:hypothetical protein